MRLTRPSIPLAILMAVTATHSALAQGSLPPTQRTGDPVADSVARENRFRDIARRVHDKVMALDTHVDISPSAFRIAPDAVNYGSRMMGRQQVDLVKMEEGGLDAAFLIVYVGQNDSLNSYGYSRAYASALEKFQAIHRLVDSIAPTRVGLALTPDDARKLHAAGKKVVFIGIENGFQMGTDLSNIQKFYDLGGRYMSLAHNGHSQLSDSNTGERDGVWRWHGLSPLGMEAIKEMNKVGMMIDVSHPSKLSMMQTLQITKAPIIASHSGARALCNHSRNLDDEQLKALKKNRGVVQLVAFSSYVKCDPARDSARTQAIADLRKEFGITGIRQDSIVAQISALPADRQALYLSKQSDIRDRRYPADARATVEDFVKHIDYVVQLIGIDHVGISSDFDGGGGVEGWNNASETFNVTLALVKHGYSDDDIAKIWSGNLLRVMGEVQDVSKKIKAGQIKP